MPSWNEMGAAFNTLRELDVTAIRDEAERAVTIVCLGERALYERVATLLRSRGAHRFGPAGADPLVHKPIARSGPEDELRRADMLLVLLDGAAPLRSADSAALARIGALSLPPPS